MEVEIDLVPSVAKQMHPEWGEIGVHHDQFIVYLIAPKTKRRIQLGYVGKKPGNQRIDDPLGNRPVGREFAAGHCDYSVVANCHLIIARNLFFAPSLVTAD